MGDRSKTKDGAPAMFFLETALMCLDGKECVFWPHARNTTGNAVIIWDDKLQLASRLVCEATYGPAPTRRYQARHSCGHGHLGCVNPMHLSWSTNSVNQMDRVAHGTSNRGEQHGRAKLAEKEVLQIRQLDGTFTRIRLAMMFGVSRRTISDVVRKRSWGHI